MRKKTGNGQSAPGMMHCVDKKLPGLDMNIQFP